MMQVRRVGSLSYQVKMVCRSWWAEVGRELSWVGRARIRRRVYGSGKRMWAWGVDGGGVVKVGVDWGAMVGLDGEAK